MKKKITEKGNSSHWVKKNAYNVNCVKISMIKSHLNSNH